MKRFNVSILALIGVLAIGLTAFTKADSAKRVEISNCYTDLTAINCLAADVPLVFNQTACLTAQAQVNRAVRTIDPLDFVEEIDCLNAQTVFCCATLEKVTAAVCTGQPSLSFKDYLGVSQTGFAKIRSITCKPIQ